MNGPAFFTCCVEYPVRFTKIHEIIAIEAKATTHNEAHILTSCNLVELDDVFSVVIINHHNTVKVL